MKLCKDCDKDDISSLDDILFHSLDAKKDYSKYPAELKKFIAKIKALYKKLLKGFNK